MRTETILLDSPIVHTFDPVTSHEAAVGVTDSGARQTLAETILVYVRRHPGLVCSEYARMLGLDRVQVARRLTDLLHAEVIAQGEPRFAAGNNRREVTWWPAQVQAALPLA